MVKVRKNDKERVYEILSGEKLITKERRESIVLFSIYFSCLSEEIKSLKDEIVFIDSYNKIHIPEGWRFDLLKEYYNSAESSMDLELKEDQRGKFLDFQFIESIEIYLLCKNFLDFPEIDYWGRKMLERSRF